MNLFLILLFSIEIPENILYLKINSFEEYDYYQVKYQIDHYLDSKKINGIILDLRDNPGGIITLAQNFCEYWIEKGKIISKNTYFSGEEKYRISKNPKPPFKDIPTVILVNQRTASAAELVALCLRYHRMAKIFGEKTAGINEIKYCQFGPKYYLRMTIGYWTIDNLSVKGGLKPDLLIKNKKKQLDIAIKYLKEMK
jgi:carboxyl-terminal processing protease